MKALSDPNRVRVLKLLQTGELCVCEIQKVLGLAQSTVSKHMKLLEDADLVARKRQGSSGLSTAWQRIVKTSMQQPCLLNYAAGWTVTKNLP